MATTAVLAGGFAAGTGESGAVGSADLTAGSTELVIAAGSSSNNPDLPRAATHTAENISATREVIGDNTGLPGDTVIYRTTVAATAAPDRLVTRIADLPIPEQYCVWRLFDPFKFVAERSGS